MFSRSRKGVGIHISENEEGEKFSGDGYFMYGNCIVNNNTVEPPWATTSRKRSLSQNTKLSQFKSYSWNLS